MAIFSIFTILQEKLYVLKAYLIKDTTSLLNFLGQFHSQCLSIPHKNFTSTNMHLPPSQLINTSTIDRDRVQKPPPKSSVMELPCHVLGCGTKQNNPHTTGRPFVHPGAHQNPCPPIVHLNNNHRDIVGTRAHIGIDIKCLKNHPLYY